MQAGQGPDAQPEILPENVMTLTRRRLLQSAAAGMALGGLGLGRAIAGGPHALRLGVTQAEIMPGLSTRDIWTFDQRVLRLRQGEAAQIKVTNALEEVTTVHWHGLRIPHAQDGVPYLSQFPIGVGETFTYEFTPPDAGTHWFHPHCNTLEQLARGAAGVLVVEEAVDPGFDADEVIELRDFRLGSDGQFIEFTRARNAARGGTLGTIITANWRGETMLQAPAGGFLRLRLAVTDITRVFRLAVAGADAKVVALDGQPVDSPMGISPLPRGDGSEPEVGPNTWPLILGPGMRADLGILMPGPGAEVQLRAGLPGGREIVLARIAAAGPDLQRKMFQLPVLPKNPLPELDLENAEVLEFTFGWSPEGDAGSSGICGDAPYRFWSINRQLWPGEGPPDASDPLAPLATLERGKTYRLRLKNETQNDHPIHLHGLAMRVSAPDRHALPPHWADTVLLRTHETREVALVADNPGDWVFHCHVIEHQKTGLAGLIRVT
jgi:FtsP/CotA-like multicopper oxidase with cupredoxin domain